MKEITLQFGGTIFIEEFNDRAEEDRIKLYDSDGEYLTYISVDWLESCGVDVGGAVSVLEYLTNKAAEEESVSGLLQRLAVPWRAIFRSKEQVAELLNTYEREIDENEWVNRIGQYYIVMPE